MCVCVWVCVCVRFAADALCSPCGGPATRRSGRGTRSSPSCFLQRRKKNPQPSLQALLSSIVIHFSGRGTRSSPSGRTLGCRSCGRSGAASLRCTREDRGPPARDPRNVTTLESPSKGQIRGGLARWPYLTWPFQGF